MEVEEAAKKEIKRTEDVIDKVEALSDEGKEVLRLAKSYLTDAKYFYEKKKFLEAFEAAVIAWAYLDAGLHLKVFKIPESMKKIFTI
jgi:hypothetical protein